MNGVFVDPYILVSNFNVVISPQLFNKLTPRVSINVNSLRMSTSNRHVRDPATD